jgi:hypothetical protein
MSNANASRGGVIFALKAHPAPTLISFASTLPLQGRVIEHAARPSDHHDCGLSTSLCTVRLR